MKTPESYEKADIKKYLDRIGCWHFSPHMAGFGKSGVPDIVACISGTLWGIEVKREGKSPTPIQEARMRQIHAAGGRACWGTAAKVVPEIEAWRVKRGLPATEGVASAPRPQTAAGSRSQSPPPQRRSRS